MCNVVRCGLLVGCVCYVVSYGLSLSVHVLSLTQLHHTITSCSDCYVTSTCSSIATCMEQDLHHVKHVAILIVPNGALKEC